MERTSYRLWERYWKCRAQEEVAELEGCGDAGMRLKGLKQFQASEGQMIIWQTTHIYLERWTIA